MTKLPFFPDLLSALWERRTTDVNDALAYIKAEYNPTHSRTPEVREQIGRAFAEALRLSLLPPGANFSSYPIILDMFLRHAKFFADQPPYRDELNNLFIYPDLFTPSYFDAEMHSPLTWDYIFTEHVSLMESFMGTPLFGRWARLPGKMDFLRQYLARSLEMMLYASLNVCDELFAAQVHWCAALIANVPELIPACEPFTAVFSFCEERAFKFQSGSRQRLRENLARVIARCKKLDAVKFISSLEALIDSPPLAWPGISPGAEAAIGKLSELRSFAAELKSSGEFTAISARAEELYKIMYASASEVAPENEDTILERNSLIAFLSNPGEVKMPTIIYFNFSPRIHYARLQFKGDSLQLSMRVPVEELVSRKSPFLTGDILSLYNGDLDRAIKCEWFCTEGLEHFAESLKASGGEYRVALVAFPSLTPVKIFNMNGYIDMTGRFARAEGLFIDRQFPAAIAAFEELAKDFPQLIDVSCMIARAYKSLAQKKIAPEVNYALANRHYQEELKKDRESVNAMIGLGIVCKHNGEFAEAEKWLENALKIAPACIPLIATYATTRMSRLMHEQKPPDEVFQDVCRHFGACYAVDPDNSTLLETANYLSNLFKKNLPDYVSQHPVDYRNM